ncbi:MAG: BatD family protein [Myxococcota bacterium]
MSALRWVLLSLALLGVTLAPRRVAAAPPTIQASLSAEEVEVDQPVQVSLEVTYEGQISPAQPRLDAPASFDVSPASTMISAYNVRINGRQSIRQSYTARWVIRAPSTGRFTIPSPSVIIDGERVRARASLRLNVVAKGTLPARPPAPRGGSFGGLGSFLFGPQPRRPFDPRMMLDDDDRPLTDEGARLRMRRAPDPHVFLRIVPSKTRAYLGEQVTLSYYVYRRVKHQREHFKRAPLDDFVRFPLDPTERQAVTEVGGRRYFVRLKEEEAVFPLRSGRLGTGVLEGTFQVPRLGRREIERRSNEVFIDVIEPPVEGRPPGYRLGDVGRRLRLTAEVVPREVEAGGTVAVSARLEGLGRLPSKLKLPARAGVEWYEPELKGDLQRVRGTIGGWRSFGYAVRLDTPGTVDLGTLSLPYWDPRAEQYIVADVALGDVVVRPVANPTTASPAGSGGPTQNAADAESSPLARLAPPRRALGPYVPARTFDLAPPLVWTGVLVPPLGVLLAGGLWTGVRTARRRRRDRMDAPARRAREALAEARSADDPKESAAHCERALHLALEARTGVKSRGLLLDELKTRLETEGLADAEAIVGLLRRCETLRFAPAGDDAGGALVAETRTHIKAILR